MKDAVKEIPNLECRNGWFYCDFIDPSGRRIRQALKTKNQKIAMQRLMKMQTEAYEKGYFEIKRPVRILFSELAIKVLEYSKDRHKAYRKFCSFMRRLEDYFGKRFLGEITTNVVRQYQDERKRKVKPATVNRELSVLRRAFNLAIQWGLAKLNPVKGVEFLKEPKGRVRFLTKEEINTLLNYCSGYLRDIVLIALHTGMRKGEIFNLKWSNVDLRNKLIVLDRTKNDEIRGIPMTNTVYEIFFAKYGEKIRTEDEYIFANKEGKPYTDIRKSFNNALASADIKNFRFHDLRHTNASWLTMSGVDVLSVQKLLGHRKVETTLRYSHLAPEYMREAVCKLENHLTEGNLCHKNDTNANSDKMVKLVLAKTV